MESSHEIISEKSVGKSARYYRKIKGTSEMPNLCLVCNESFISFAALSQHIIGKHSKIECFECDHCGKKGKQKNNVKTYCTRRHPEINFNVKRINEKESEAFIHKNSFKGTLESYNLKKESRKIVKKIVKPKTELEKQIEESNENDDSLSTCSTETSLSENNNLIENEKSLSIADLYVEQDDNFNIDVKILFNLKPNLKSLLIQKIKTSIEEVKLLNSLC